MTGPMHDRVQKAYEDLERARNAVGDVERSMNSSETTVTSKNRAITVRLDGRGELTEIKFMNNAYRTMAPAELAALLVETITTARRQARETMAGLLQSVLPAGMPVLDMLTKPLNLDDVMRQADDLVGGLIPKAARGPNESGGEA
ncbi:YbaB/EbfC family nucleoid-associated protein [Micromonospora sp. NPDC049275]|uniref:YbaB/EbfC family nucleoid-associated protein n=1 Tax=Micromonospora sp. NPDC049275 TaxID=3364268 RepID=UPI003719CF7B